MSGIERSLTWFTINTGGKAYFDLMGADVLEVIAANPNYGKGDTLGLDAIPEIVIRKAVKDYDPRAVFVTEETDEETVNRLPDTTDPQFQPLVFVSDPTDRSKYLNKFIMELIKRRNIKLELPEDSLKSLDGVTLKELMDEFDSCQVWDEIFEGPAAITGATSAISCIYQGKVVVSVVVNYISQTISVASKLGVYCIPISQCKSFPISNLGSVLTRKNEIIFELNADNDYMNQSEADVAGDKRFVTFLGKSGYKEHFQMSKIFASESGVDKNLHHKEPGGPSRVLYLSDIQGGEVKIGFILANGEKITEWVHWLPFVKYSKTRSGENALKIYEVYTGELFEKGGVLMSTPRAYSIFRENKAWGPYLDVNMLKRFDQPSHFRSMIIITRRSNEWCQRVMTQNCYREIIGFF